MAHPPHPHQTHPLGATLETLALQRTADQIGTLADGITRGASWLTSFARRMVIAIFVFLGVGGGPRGMAQSLEPAIACIRPEQRDIEFRPPLALPEAGVPDVEQIPTVKDPLTGRPTYYLSLDEALQIAILNCRVVRVLTGVSAGSTGATIYDAAITNTLIDEARGRFDPRLSVENLGGRIDTPFAVPDANDPSGARFQGSAVESFNHISSLTKTTTGGGTGALSLRANPSKVGNPGQLLNPQTSSSLDLSLSQPLLRGRGRGPNLAPIVIARIDTERSFYQLQDSVHSLVRSIIASQQNSLFIHFQLQFKLGNIWSMLFRSVDEMCDFRRMVISHGGR